MAHPSMSDDQLHAVHLILGGAGFIGSNVARALHAQGCRVLVADYQPCGFMTPPEFCSQVVYADLREKQEVSRVFACAGLLAQQHHPADPQVWVYLFAADMGGMGYIEANEGAILLSNTAITLHVVRACNEQASLVSRLLLASSACVYPKSRQADESETQKLQEDCAWPAEPQDGYGLEKLYGEELAMRTAVSMGSKLQVRVVRFHNVFGPQGTWIGGREKAPAAFLRKALFLQELDKLAPGNSDKLEVWGDGKQVRTFCLIDDAVRGVVTLMRSDCRKPVNIGSDADISINDLALLAGDVVGLPRAALTDRIYHDADGPLGVQGRSADLARAKTELGWAPEFTLRQGLERTAQWMRTEIDWLRAAFLQADPSQSSWIQFLREGITSQKDKVPSPRRFGLLVPVTSRNSTKDALLANLRKFLHSVHTTVFDQPSMSCQIDLLFGVDEGDALCDPASPSAINWIDLARSVMPEPFVLGQLTVRVRTFNYPPGSVCRIWSELAADAFSAGADFTVLLGDDIILQSAAWPETICQAFASISQRTGLPYGFGCVAFADAAFPGFPTFPVIHRVHMDVFAGCLFPSFFRNQDADPFLFQIYRAFNAAVLEPRARLANTVGGMDDARYKKQHVPWTGQLLTRARLHAAQWLDMQRTVVGLLPRYTPVITLDVIVPTFRAPKDILQRILSLPVPAHVSTSFIIICDNPASPAARAVMEELQAEHRDNAMVRIRTNSHNVGAGRTRNHGLDESSADWVLFLDDDVVPRDDILEKYALAIQAHPRATGFIGLSVLPPAATPRQAGVYIAGVAFFWTAALTFSDSTELPWGVTANICVRRPEPGTIEFGHHFPRTGGGEDIDFCLRLREQVRHSVPNSEGFVAVPNAVIHHPWWDGGSPKLSHFSGWARGDGQLIDLFPHLSYRNWPELAELLVGVATVGTLQLAARAANRSLHLHVLRKLTSSRAIACTAAIGGAFIAADLLLDTWKELMTPFVTSHVTEEPREQLPLMVRLLGVGHGLLIRTTSEGGRIVGHLARRRLLRNLGRRFNWFGTMWPGAVQVERKNALKRTVMRAVVASLVLVWGSRCLA